MVKKIVSKILTRRLTPIRVKPGSNNQSPSLNFGLPGKQLQIVMSRRTVNANKNTSLKSNGIGLGELRNTSCSRSGMWQ